MNKSLSQADVQYIWHPYTQHGTAGLAVPIARAQGAYLYDQDGKRYIDLISSWWVNIHGHGHPALQAAIARQATELDHIMFAGFTHEPAVTLAQRLLKISGFTDGKVFYSDDGSTAVESALKMAIQYWKNRGEPRQRILALEGAYHGDTFGAMSIGKKSGYFGSFDEFFFEVDFADVPEIWIGQTDDGQEARALERAKKILESAPGQFAALIVEPLVQGAVGMRFYSVSYLEKLGNLARSHGALLIFDEIMTGFGRTGTFFAFEQTSIKPDIICVSKGITGGTLPLAATLARGFIFENFIGNTFEKALAHGHSYTGNPIACAVANASLDLFESNRCLEKVALINRWYQQHFLPFCERHSCLEKPRLLGDIAAVNLSLPDHDYGGVFSYNLYLRYLSEGLIIRPMGQAIYLLPPYCIEEPDIQAACHGIDASLP